VKPAIYSAAYRKACFAAHEKRCVVCLEELLVEVHHYDGDRSNSCVTNLIPLCPTHHRYWHSKFKSVVEQAISEYREAFLETRLDESVPMIDEDWDD